MLVSCAQSRKQPFINDRAMTTWSDEALVSWACGNQPDRHQAMSTLLARHRNWIHRRCQFRLGYIHEAEDATQEIALRVCRNLHQFEGRARFKAWLNTIIDNHCNTVAVRSSRCIASEHISDLIEIYQQEYGGIDPYDVLIEQDLVQRVLSHLPQNAREVLRLRFYCEHSLEDIANTLHVSLSAAKARLYRAMEQFKQTCYELMTVQ